MAANRSLSSFRRRERRKRPRKANNGLTAAGVRASTVTGKWRSVVKVRQRTWQKTCQTQLIREVCRKKQASFFAERQNRSEPDGVLVTTSSRLEIFLLTQKRHSSLAGMLHSGQKKSVNLESTSFLETTSKERKRDVNKGDCHHSTTPVSQSGLVLKLRCRSVP